MRPQLRHGHAWILRHLGYYGIWKLNSAIEIPGRWRWLPQFDCAIQMVVPQADLLGHTDHLPEPVPALLVAEPATDQFVP